MIEVNEFFKEYQLEGFVIKESMNRRDWKTHWNNKVYGSEEIAQNALSTLVKRIGYEYRIIPVYSKR